MNLHKSNFAWFCLICSFFIQREIFSPQEVSASLSAYHFLLTIIFLWQIFKYKLLLPVTNILYISIILILLYGLSIVSYGFRLNSLQYIFMVMAFYLGGIYSITSVISDRENIYKLVAFIVVLYLFTRNIYFYDKLEIIYSRSRLEGLSNPFIAMGGRNIESTLLAILSILLINQKSWYFLLIMIATITSLLIESRAGILSCLLSVILYLIYHSKNKLSKGMIFSLLSLGCISILQLAYLTSFDVFTRFDLTDEINFFNEEVGRLFIWSITLDTIISNPAGVGIGNGIAYLESFYGFPIRENNVHNIYLQWMLELGILGLLFLIYTLKLIVKDFFLKSTPENSLCLFYLTIGLIQFTGFEPYIFFFIGFVFHNRVNILK